MLELDSNSGFVKKIFTLKLLGLARKAFYVDIECC